jgi:radical SAM protein (TIGR01212 family)
MRTTFPPTGQTVRRYSAFGHFMRERYGVPVYKVNVDAGFTCPNRDGTISVGGCIYCNNDSFRPRACAVGASVRDQIERGMPYLRRRYGAERFLVYFQPFTNTYASVAVLERLYRDALDMPDVVGLAIGTRPDCVDKEKIALLEDLARDRFILVEYGLQSIHNRTLEFINRGHDFAAFHEAVEMTAGRGIHVGAHLILGFPTETRDDMLETADTLSRLPIGFLKLHQLQVIRDTVLAERFSAKPFPTLGYEEYLELVAEFLEHLSPDIVLQRLFAAAPDDILIAPKWNRTRSEFLHDLDACLERSGKRQGGKYQSR